MDDQNSQPGYTKAMIVYLCSSIYAIHSLKTRDLIYSLVLITESCAMSLIMLNGEGSWCSVERCWGWP